MHTHGSLIRKSLLLMGCLVVFSACNQQEFYEKQFLEGVGVADDRIPDPDISLPSDPGDQVTTTYPQDQTNPGDVSSGDNGDADGGVVIVTPPAPTDPSDIGSGDSSGDVVTTDPADTTGSTNPTDPSDIGSGDSSGDVVTTDPADTTGSSNPTDPSDIGSGDSSGDVVTTDPADTTDSTDPTDPGNTGGDVVIVDPVPTPEPTPEVILLNKVEKFVQNKAQEAPVDIMWVIDDSGSMGDEQRSLAYNFDVFINEFIEKKIDFQMSITTTDPTSRGDGKWKINPVHLTSIAAAKNEKKFLNDFKRTIQVGTNGSGTEMGLHTANRYLERYENSNQHKWLRDDAYLIIVVLSDEEEQSDSSVEKLVESYQSYKKNAGMVKVYTIVTTDLRGQQWETIGKRYMKAANLTNGVVADIHQDFYSVLRDMGTKIVDLLDQFALAASPYQGVAVMVNGNLVETGYAYNNDTKTIKFLEGHIPAEGSQIEVHYQVEQSTSTLLASGSN